MKIISQTSKIALILVFFWMVFPVVNVNAAILETLQVSSLNSIPVQSSTILEVGKMYVIETNGTYTFAPGDRIADAEFAYNPDTDSWNEDFGDVYEQYVLDLIVNGEPRDWFGSINGIDFYPHTFSPNHLYRLYVEGQGLPLSFYINDRSYDWNEGYLNVTINTVSLTDKKECKNLGWKTSSESFKNQGMCIKTIRSK